MQMKPRPIVGKNGLIVLSFASVLLCLRASPPQTEAGTPCLIPAGSVPLDGVEGRLDHLAVDVQSQRLFVSGLENHTIEVVDLAKRQRIHEITGISEPQGLVFIPEKNRLIVCSRGDGTCRSFDANIFEEGPWVDLGRNADNVRFDAGAKMIYVGSAGEPGNGLLSAMDLGFVAPGSTRRSTRRTAFARRFPFGPPATGRAQVGNSIAGPSRILSTRPGEPPDLRQRPRRAPDRRAGLDPDESDRCRQLAGDRGRKEFSDGAERRRRPALHRLPQTAAPGQLRHPHRQGAFANAVRGRCRRHVL